MCALSSEFNYILFCLQLQLIIFCSTLHLDGFSVAERNTKYFEGNRDKGNQLSITISLMLSNKVGYG